MMRLLALIATLAGCYNPAYENCAISCAQSQACPSGFDCVAGRCQVPGQSCTTSDGGMLVDADVTGWQFRKKITFAAPQGSATDFPLLVRVRDQDLASFAQDDGGDIRFTTTDLLGLSHEIELFNGNLGDIVAWVRVPRIIAGSATELYMYYGNASAPDQAQPAAVWTGHAAVYHLADAPGTTIADATGAHAGTKPVANTPSPSTGLIGGAHAFNGTTNDSFFASNSSGFSTGPMTFEAWLDVTAGPNTSLRRLLASPAGGVQHGLLYQDPSATGGGQLHIAPLLPNTQGLMTPAIISDNQWQHVMVTWDPGDSTVPVHVYVNGTNLVPQPSPAIGAVDVPALYVGAAPGATHPGPFGLLDEVRISNSVRSEDWAKLSYQLGVQSGNAPLTFGPAETL